MMREGRKGKGGMDFFVEHPCWLSLLLATENCLLGYIRRVNSSEKHHSQSNSDCEHTSFLQAKSKTLSTTIMQFRVFAAISCMVALAMVNTADSQLTAVSLAVVVIAGLAIAKEKLIAAEIHRQYIRRPVHEEYEAPSSGYGHKRVAKREAAEASFEPMFESAALLDTDDCAKMLICQSFEKPEEQLNTFEQKINKLFANDFQKIDAQSQKADFQLAAYVGSLRQPGLCQQRYAKCLVSPDVLSDVRL